MGARDRDPQNHPWWNHVPQERRLPTLQRRRWRLLRSALGSQTSRLILVFLAYGGLTLALAVSGAGAMSTMILVPLLVVPALAAVAWWLTWTEFHH